MKVNKAAGEACDDGNMIDNDGCSSTCQLQQVLATQDFELVPAMPVWTYTGTPSDFQMGLSPANATPANSPLGIGASRAWHVRQVSGGNPLEFADVAIPTGFDRITLRFRLAAMNLNGAFGGPDNLDYVLLELKVDGGSYYPRVRIRGALQNNCSWAYDATAVASVPHLPMMEMMFQPTTSGLQTVDGYSTVEVTFPGTVNQIGARITPRSSTTSDSWLIDDLELIGETL